MITRVRGMMVRTFASMMLASFVLYGAFFGIVTQVLAVAPPNIVNYQGRLLNANGVPVSDTSLLMKFELYTASSGGTCVWSNQSADCDANTPALTTARAVTLTDGLFSENIGDTAAATPYAAIADAIFGDNATLYLQVYVADEPLSPRKRIVAAPYALNANTVDGFNTTQVGGTSALAVVLDSSGNLQLTGNPSGSAVSNGSVYVNPASLDVSANDVVLGVAVGGSSRLTVDAEGDVTAIGNIYANGGTVSSTSALVVSSSTGNVQIDAAGGSPLVWVSAGDDFSVGASSLVSAFSVDESLNTLRIGDGTSDANDPSITFYASDATDSGTFSYADSDTFTFASGNFLHTGLGVLPTSMGGSSLDHQVTSTFTGTSGNLLSSLAMSAFSASTNYSGIEGGSTDHIVKGAESTLTISGATSTVTRGFGFSADLINSSTNASLLQAGGYLAGITGGFTHNAAATTLAAGYGVYGIAGAGTGTLTSGVGVYGTVENVGGTLTAGYGGQFVNTVAGTSRYGIYAEASGGTTNYAGYFASGLVQIDGNSTPDTPGTATGAGDLFVTDALEVDGSFVIGDGTGTDALTYVSAVSTTDAMTVTTNSLTSGNALTVTRAIGGADFDGVIAAFNSYNNSPTSDGEVVNIVNAGGGTSVGLYIKQTTTSAHSADATGNNALVIDTGEDGSTDDAIILRSGLTGGGEAPTTRFRVTTAGELYADGAVYNSGADYAEYFRTNDTSLLGTRLTCQDQALAEGVKLCGLGDERIVGVVSTNAGFVGNNVGGASEDLTHNASYELVGLVGQIETSVNAGEGAIAVGDPISTSSVMAGYGAKAHGPARIVGFALEPLTSGAGTIRVLVQPQWYGGDVLNSEGGAIVATADVMLDSLATATSSVSSDSRDLVLRGSGWSAGAVAKDIALRNVVEDGGDTYRLSVVNDDGVESAYIGSNGDLAIAGRLYPSDRGLLQAEKYIYYDGSSGSGGDFMRTNASGWGSGSYDFAEMFPSLDLLAAGEVVVFADQNESIRRSTGETYDDRIAGVVSTRPGFLAGDNNPGDVPVALAGRVPTYVSGENGAIAIGDPLTTSSKAGYAMKATEPGPIVGYAMEAFAGNTGVVVAFIRPSYFDGGVVDAPIAENVVSEVSSVAQLDVSGSMNMNGGSIISVASLVGIGDNWRIMENGDFVTRGSIVALIRSFAGDDVETYASLGRERTIQLSGTSTLDEGAAHVEFEDIDPAFNDIIASEVPYRVIVTPAGVTGTVYVAQRTVEGFTIRDDRQTDGVAVDWLVIAYHKDFAPDVVTPDVLAPETEEAAEEPIEPSDDVIEDVTTEEVIVTEDVVVEEEEEPAEVTDEVPVVEDAVIEAPEPIVITEDTILTPPETP